MDMHHHTEVNSTTTGHMGMGVDKTRDMAGGMSGGMDGAMGGGMGEDLMGSMNGDMNMSEQDNHYHHHHHEHHDHHQGNEGQMKMVTESVGQGHGKGHVMSDTGHMGSMKNMAGMKGMQMHAMHFTPLTVTDFLIEGLTISSIQGIIVAILSVMIATVVLEGLNIWLHYRELMARKNRRSNAETKCHRLLTALSSSIIKMFTVFLGYLVMLSVMSMNIWLFVSAIVGSGIGHLLLRPFLTAKLSTSVEKGEKSPETEMLSVQRIDTSQDTGVTEVAPMLT